MIRTEPDSSRRNHIRIEGCLIRGMLADACRIGGGSCDVVLRDSLVGTAGGPLFRLDGADAASECRIFLVNSVLTGPGPIIEITGAAAGGATKPPAIRSYGTVFGRLRASGIASVVCSRDSIPRPGKLFDWSGDDNLFAGWKGFFACGERHRP